MPPVIETARLRLYPPCLGDLEARLAMDRDPEVMRYIRPVPDDAERHRAELHARILGRQPPAGVFWHVAWKDRPEFLGVCGVFDLEDSGLKEIGYRFVAEAWGQGIASEAARAALDHGFRVLGLDPIVAVTDPDNLASQGVLRKIGLPPAGRAVHYGREVAFFRLSRAAYLTAGQSPSTSFME